MNRPALLRSILAAALLSALLPAPIAAGPDTYRMKLPDTVWAVSIDLTGFEIDREEMRDDETGAMVGATNPETGVILSLFLEKEKKERTSVQCRKKYFRKSLHSPIPKTEVAQWEEDRLAFGQYRVKGTGVTHLHAYLGRRDVCLDLHLSKGGFEESDRATFDAIVSSLKTILME